MPQGWHAGDGGPSECLLRGNASVAPASREEERVRGRSVGVRVCLAVTQAWHWVGRVVGLRVHLLQIEKRSRECSGNSPSPGRICRLVL